MAEFVEEPKKGPPAYMVSFGDMMTLILTFFILLVSMSKEQNYGLMAQGVGSFIVAVKSHGMDGVMSGEDKLAVFEHMRRRFSLPPEDDPEQLADHALASTLEIITAKTLEALKPHVEIGYPTVAVFEDDSSLLTEQARSYLDRLASSLEPRRRQLLHIEGHALDAGPEHAFDNTYLAFARAQAVRAYLLEKHRFRPERVQAHAWMQEVEDNHRVTHSADARLITPTRSADE